MERTYEDLGSFEEELRGWFERSPFLALAVCLHLLLLFALNAIPWRMFVHEEPTILTADVVAPPEERFEEPVVVPPPQLVDPQVVEPVVTERFVETEELAFSDDLHDAASDPSPFANEALDSTLGLGSGGGLDGGPIGRRRRGVQDAPPALERSIAAGLDWLARHQEPDGHWAARHFADRCGEDDEPCNGDGDALHDTGVTGLALLAFLGAGQTQLEGEYRDAVRAAIGWLHEQQDEVSGRLGPSTSNEHLYDHAIATLALSEAYTIAKDPLSKHAARRAVEYCLKARNEYGAWRYAVPANGENDTSITGWMVFALASASHAQIDIGKHAPEGALAFLDEVTDPASGRAGYTERGESSSRLTRLMAAYPIEKTEALTAVAVLSRVFLHELLGEDPADDPLLALGAERMLECLPEWDPTGGGAAQGWAQGDPGATNDMYYWYYGSYALYQLGGKPWATWRKAVENAILPNQRATPACAAGSWDPSGPWGSTGGRVYATALMVLTLEVTFRYERLLAPR